MDPERDDPYWECDFDGAASMAAKYAALHAALAQTGPARDRALREAARRWSGSLRECQRVEPTLYAARGAAAARGAEAAAEPRRAWRARGEQAICLWADLHDLLRDQRDAPRTGALRPTARDAMRELARRAGMDMGELARVLDGHAAP